LLATGLFVAAVVFAATRSSNVAPAAVSNGSPDAPAVGAPASGVERTTSHTVGVAQPVRIPPLRTLKAKAPKYGPVPETDFESYPARQPGSSTRDTVVQRSAPKNRMPSPILTFDGVSNLCGCYPPDTEGDVGPNHYMEWVNAHYAIYTKTGTQVVPPTTGNTLFTGTPFCGAHNNGDPIVLYDQFAQRWMVSQFAFNSTSQGPFYQCIAVSNSSDPTAGWCAYEFLVHQTKFNDYPKFGIWPAQNTYTMTAPQFNSTGGQGVWGFERDKMIACEPARFVYQDMVGLDPTLPRILPADADGPTAPPAGAPQPIVTDEDDGAGYPADRIVIWNATMTWGATPSITLTHDVDLPVAAFDQDVGCGGGRTCIPQPGTTVKVDALPNRPMYRAAYRNFGSYQALAWDHTVDADAPSGNRAGMRWYELRKTSGAWGVQNQGTFGPADGLYRWMGSAAMDGDGNLAVGYSIGNGTAPNYPSIAYAGRLAGDPPNELSQGESMMFSGTGSQTGTASRWGDYSMMTTDPVDDCTFWYTTEYLQTTGPNPWRTRIGSFKFPSCGQTPPPPPPPPPPTRCRVPRVLGLRLGAAKTKIRRAHCSVGRVRHVRSRRSLRGRVVNQAPRPGALKRRGFPVSMAVGRG